MHQQAQLRLKKHEVERLGAEVFVVLAMDLHRTRVFKEENLLLGLGKGKFAQEKSLVYATALSDPAGYASAVYGVARKCLRWGAWVENQPHWFVIAGGRIYIGTNNGEPRDPKHAGDRGVLMCMSRR